MLFNGVSGKTEYIAEAEKVEVSFRMTEGNVHWFMLQCISIYLRLFMTHTF